MIFIIEFLFFIAILGFVGGKLIDYNGAFIQGWVGENFVSKRLSTLDKNHYLVLNNLLISSSGHTSTTQIDHVVVSNYGIFCIETKALSGIILGGAYDKYWMQIIFHYRKRFYNPLRQNYAHTKSLEALIKPFYPNAPIISFVAFTNTDKIRVSGTTSVGTSLYVLEKIKTYTNPVIPETDRDEIYKILKAYNIRDKKFRSEHTQNVRGLKNLQQ